MAGNLAFLAAEQIDNRGSKGNHGGADAEQLRTRIGAFIEMLNG